MDRFAANTLRTLGIVITSIFVILGCLVLFLLALCFGIIAKAGGSGHSDPQTSALAFGALVAAAVLIAIGVGIVTRLAKGIMRANAAASPSYALIAPTSAPAAKQLGTKPPTLSDEAKLDQALASYEAMAKRAEPPHKAEPQLKVEPPPRPVPAVPSRPLAALARPVDINHLSPASRAAIQQLGLAIAAKIVAEVALGLVGWFGALGVPSAPFPLYKAGFLAWGLAAIAPNLVLLCALARRPGPRAFAYALVIPSLHLLFGLFGHSAFLAFILRAGQLATPLLSIAPWFFDILILYLAWKAIRQTGIEPNPARLIVASAVIFLYTSLLPAFVLLLNYFDSARGHNGLS